ncbi:unnamed protein product [Haemonchus placei]|uniref:ZP domain-containing protein n=1 Tax=Haemonchus placei TaxID=6290 RepID=A0A0N4W7Y4_HAEPC|nr:unnamed protein product [Haemonchus placei]
MHCCRPSRDGQLYRSVPRASLQFILAHCSYSQTKSSSSKKCLICCRSMCASWFSHRC